MIASPAAFDTGLPAAMTYFKAPSLLKRCGFLPISFSVDVGRAAAVTCADLITEIAASALKGGPSGVEKQFSGGSTQR